MDLAGWKVAAQEVLPINGSDPLTMKTDGEESKSDHSSPEKKKVLEPHPEKPPSVGSFSAVIVYASVYVCGCV